MSSFADMFQDAGPWGFAVFGSTLLMLFISLVVTHIPLKWLGKIPTILHGIFLFPFLILLVGITIGLGNMSEAVMQAPPEYGSLMVFKGTGMTMLLYLMLGLYSLVPFWLAFRSMMAFWEVQKAKDWKDGFMGLLPSLSIWMLATIGSGVIWMMSETRGYGPAISFGMILSFAAIVPFSSMTQHKEDGDKLAFFSNYLGFLGVWVLFLASWGYEWYWRLDLLASAPEDMKYLAFSDPFGVVGTGITSVLGILFFVLLFYYAVKMRAHRIQAIALTIISLGMFSTTYLIGATGDSLIEKAKSAQTE